MAYQVSATGQNSCAIFLLGAISGVLRKLVTSTR